MMDEFWWFLLAKNPSWHGSLSMTPFTLCTSNKHHHQLNLRY